MNLTPKNILERHKIFPEATEQLIEFYANAKIKEKVEQLIFRSAVTRIPANGIIVIVAPFDDYDQYTRNDIYRGIDIKTLEMSDKAFEQAKNEPEPVPQEQPKNTLF